MSENSISKQSDQLIDEKESKCNKFENLITDKKDIDLESINNHFECASINEDSLFKTPGQ